MDAEEDEIESCNSLTEEDQGSSVFPYVRRLFKLGSALNIPPEAPGRISTAYRSLTSEIDQYEAGLQVKNTAIETKETKR